jgi:hypothetical protein
MVPAVFGPAKQFDVQLEFSCEKGFHFNHIPPQTLKGYKYEIHVNTGKRADAVPVLYTNNYVKKGKTSSLSILYFFSADFID